MSDSNRSRARRYQLAIYLDDTEFERLVRLKVRGHFSTKNAVFKSLLFRAWMESERRREGYFESAELGKQAKNTSLKLEPTQSTDTEELPGQLRAPWAAGGGSRG